MKVLFSDFDGTLVESSHLKNKDDIKAIEKFRKQGNLFVICTGRCIHEIKRDYALYNIPFDYMILNNGSQIIDSNFQSVYLKTIEHDAGIAILDQLMTYKDMHVYFSDDEVSYGYFNGLITNQLTGKEEKIDFVKRYHQSNHFHILCYFQDNHKTDISVPLLNQLKQTYINDVEIYLNQIFVDIVPKGCSKGKGVNLLLDLLNIKAETYAIGDSYNDLPMIEAVNYGYTFNDVDISSEVKLHVENINELIGEII